MTANPAGGDADLAATLTVASDPAGTPAGQAAVIAQALSNEFANHLSSFAACPAAKFNNLQGPTAANCPDRTAILGTGTLVTRDQAGVDTSSDQGFLVKTAANAVVFWWHTPAKGGAVESFGQAPGVVSQETGLYGPVVTYDFTSLPAGARLKQLGLTYQRNATTGKAPFVARRAWAAPGASRRGSSTSAAWPPSSRRRRSPAACPRRPRPSRRSSSSRGRRSIRRAGDRHPRPDHPAGVGQRQRSSSSPPASGIGWTAPVNAADGRIRTRESIPAAQASKGTGILTITYPGDAVTRPQVVRLRAASVPALLDASRPTIESGHLLAHGTISGAAHGVVRVQLEYYSAGKTTTLERYATIAGGAWSLDAALTADQQTAIASAPGTVHSYILFTGYLPRRMRGEMVSYQVLGARSRRPGGAHDGVAPAQRSTITDVDLRITCASSPARRSSSSTASRVTTATTRADSVVSSTIRARKPSSSTETTRAGSRLRALIMWGSPPAGGRPRPPAPPGGCARRGTTAIRP